MSLSKQLIIWYKKHQRNLPFRETKDAYKIWLSEIILQQTRVEQGLPYYYRFTEKFPNVFSLAQASQEEVLKLWQGLGYYSRGRNLHEAANSVVKNYNGVFPANYHKLLQLKGVGAYTAAAIASFAFNMPHAVVDGNVSRVLSRLFAVNNAINSSAGKKIMEELAEEVMDKKHVALHNYAMMELGALVCKPKNPLCEQCPLSGFCMAFKQKTQALFPVKDKKSKVQDRFFFYFVIESRNKFYIKKRTNKDIWHNLYDFPLIETPAKVSALHVMQSDAFKKVFNGLSFKIVSVSEEYLHQLTHRNVHAVFIHLKIKSAFNKKLTSDWILISLDQLHEKYALPRLIEKYVNKLAVG